MLLDQLRLHTRPLHAELDRHPRLQLLLSPSLSLDEYADLLERFFGFYEPMERLFASLTPLSALPPLPGLALRDHHAPPYSPLKHALLQSDLQCLGRDAAGLPSCASVPAEASTAEAWGYAYVLEGSSLGGQVIAKHLRRSLGLTATDGAAFFVGHGSETRRRWDAFCRALNTWPADAADQQSAVGAACKAFLLLKDWL